ncbi:hypothetical protein WA158_003357 [Blastocystis sp. Blastoise]
MSSITKRYLKQNCDPRLFGGSPPKSNRRDLYHKRYVRYGGTGFEEIVRQQTRDADWADFKNGVYTALPILGTLGAFAGYNYYQKRKEQKRQEKAKEEKKRQFEEHIEDANRDDELYNDDATYQPKRITRKMMADDDKDYNNANLEDENYDDIFGQGIHRRHQKHRKEHGSHREKEKKTSKFVTPQIKIIAKKSIRSSNVKSNKKKLQDIKERLPKNDEHVSVRDIVNVVIDKEYPMDPKQKHSIIANTAIKTIKTIVPIVVNALKYYYPSLGIPIDFAYNMITTDDDKKRKETADNYFKNPSGSGVTKENAERCGGALVNSTSFDTTTNLIINLVQFFLKKFHLN